MNASATRRSSQLKMRRKRGGTDMYGERDEGCAGVSAGKTFEETRQACRGS
jgi:hypothetical protein